MVKLFTKLFEAIGCLAYDIEKRRYCLRLLLAAEPRYTFSFN